MVDPILQPTMLCQVGFVVKDVVATAQKYADALGLPMPPIVQTPGFERSQMMVGGQPSEASAKICVFQTGQMTLELIEPDENPSVWRDFLDRNGEGVHHIAFRVADTQATEAAFAEHGVHTEQQARFRDGSGMYTYLDSVPLLGVMIELQETFKK